MRPSDVARVPAAVVPHEARDRPARRRSVDSKDYVDRDGAWEALGQTPIADQQLPFGYYRLRIVKPGYVPLEIGSPMLGRPPIITGPRVGERPRDGAGSRRPIQRRRGRRRCRCRTTGLARPR